MKHKIFISGVQKELKEERVAVKNLIAENVLLKEYFKVFLFEDSPAKSKSAKTAFLNKWSLTYANCISEGYSQGSVISFNKTTAVNQHKGDMK